MQLPKFFIDWLYAQTANQNKKKGCDMTLLPVIPVMEFKSIFEVMHFYFSMTETGPSLSYKFIIFNISPTNQARLEIGNIHFDVHLTFVSSTSLVIH